MPIKHWRRKKARQERYVVSTVSNGDVNPNTGDAAKGSFKTNHGYYRPDQCVNRGNHEINDSLFTHAFVNPEIGDVNSENGDVLRFKIFKI
jgi:hypothetical protein